MKNTMLRNFFKKFPSFHNTPETAKMLDHVTHDGLVTVFGKVVAQKTNDLLRVITIIDGVSGDFGQIT